MDKIWIFNCFGVCIGMILENEIDAWNEKHHIFNQKIVSWKKVQW